MQSMGRLGLALTLTEAAQNAVVMTVFLHEGKQLGAGAAAMAQGRRPQGVRACGRLTGGEQAVVDMAQHVGSPVRQRHGHQQIRQVVVGHHQGCHGFVRIRPAGELLTG